MSCIDWKIGRRAFFVGLANYIRSCRANQRFLESVVHTFYFTALAVVAAADPRHARGAGLPCEFPFRGVLRALFIMPMMATPVAVALVWTMMFHPQQGVLNYLLVARRPAAVALGLSTGDRDPEPGPGRDLALDAAGDADRAGRPRRAADRALRERAARRRQRLADVPLHHAAAGLAVHAGRRGHPHHRRAEDLRHHLRDHAGRAGQPRRRRSTSISTCRPSPIYNIGYASAVVVVFFVHRAWRWRCCCSMCARDAMD